MRVEYWKHENVDEAPDLEDEVMFTPEEVATLRHRDSDYELARALNYAWAKRVKQTAEIAGRTQISHDGAEEIAASLGLIHSYIPYAYCKELAVVVQTCLTIAEVADAMEVYSRFLRTYHGKYVSPSPELTISDKDFEAFLKVIREPMFSHFVALSESHSDNKQLNIDLSTSQGIVHTITKYNPGMMDKYKIWDERVKEMEEECAWTHYDAIEEEWSAYRIAARQSDESRAYERDTREMMVRGYFDLDVQANRKAEADEDRGEPESVDPNRRVIWNAAPETDAMARIMSEFGMREKYLLPKNLVLALNELVCLFEERR